MPDKPYTNDDVERVARVLHAYHYGGCVSWHDTTDTATTGDEESRRRALDEASRALDALFSTDLWLRPTREEAERIREALYATLSEWGEADVDQSLLAKLSALADQEGSRDG